MPTRLCLGTILEVKFFDDTGVYLLCDELVDADANPVLHNDFLSNDHILKITPAFTRSPADLNADRRRAQSLSSRPIADLTQYFHFEVTPDTAPSILQVIQSHPSVQNAVILPDRAIPCSLKTTPDFSEFQEYLFDASGPHLSRAWSYPGGKGDNVTIALIESHCNRHHEDLVHRTGSDDVVIGGLPGGLPGAINHGTAVAGMLIAGDNGFGVTGICHNASIRIYFADAPELLANAIDITQSALDTGDVILIELQVPGPNHTGGDDQFGMVPVEYIPSVFDAISLAGVLGRIVIEPAGNGSQNLDDPVYENRFNPEYIDSWAIMVGAGRPADRAAVSYTNYGSRLNVQGWSERMNPCCQVWSTGFGNAPGSPERINQLYTDQFSGTSSASAMVAGAIVCLQGAALLRAADYLSPHQIRDILVQTGYPQNGSKHIGSLPDVESAIESIPIATVITDLTLNHTDFTANDPFVLKHSTVNPWDSQAVIKYLALCCYDDWFFLDCDSNTFVHYIEGCPEILATGETNEVFLSFPWPEGDFGHVQSGSGVAFHLVFMNLFENTLLSNVDSVTFGWY